MHIIRSIWVLMRARATAHAQASTRRFGLKYRQGRRCRPSHAPQPNLHARLLFGMRARAARRACARSRAHTEAEGGRLPDLLHARACTSARASGKCEPEVGASPNSS